MIGAILAGGFGKRLRPLSNSIPKPLIPIKDDYTIMDRQLFDFATIGVKEVYVLSGHLGEKIEQRYGERTQGIVMHYLREEKPMGTLFSLRNLLGKSDKDDIILRNGDTVTDMNFKRFVDFSKNSNYGLTIFVVKMRSPFGIVDLLGDQVTNFREKPLLEHYMNAGIYYIKKSTFNYFSKEYVEKDIEKTVFPELTLAKQVGAYREDTFWIGVDSEKELDQVREEYRNRTDYAWGFKKELFSNERFVASSYYVKSGESVDVELRKGSLARIISGYGLILNENSNRFKENDIIVGDNPVKIQAESDTTFEMFFSQ